MLVIRELNPRAIGDSRSESSQALKASENIALGCKASYCISESSQALKASENLAWAARPRSRIQKRAERWKRAREFPLPDANQQRYEISFDERYVWD
jgi:hypothetical protein